MATTLWWVERGGSQPLELGGQGLPDACLRWVKDRGSRGGLAGFGSSHDSGIRIISFPSAALQTFMYMISFHPHVPSGRWAFPFCR